jgi:hypothetical protein
MLKTEIDKMNEQANKLADQILGESIAKIIAAYRKIISLDEGKIDDLVNSKTTEGEFEEDEWIDPWTREERQMIQENLKIIGDTNNQAGVKLREVIKKIYIESFQRGWDSHESNSTIVLDYAPRKLVKKKKKR